MRSYVYVIKFKNNKYFSSYLLGNKTKSLIGAYLFTSYKECKKELDFWYKDTMAKVVKIELKEQK